MNRRTILQSAGTLGVGLLAVGTTSQEVGGSVDSEPTASDTSTIQQGRRILKQAQYDNGSRPSKSPAVERIHDDINRETHTTVLTTRTAAACLAERLRESTVPIDDLSISKRFEDDSLQLIVDHPETAVFDHWQTILETSRDEIRQEIRAAVDETHRDRLDEIAIEIDHRKRPPLRYEHGCESRIGRFADAQYRANGIAMGAAARSETLGEIASTGFRGLREGHAVIVTTAHTFETNDDQNPRELRGKRLYQSRRPHTIGRCHAVGRGYGPGVDAAAVAVDTTSYPSRFLADPGGDSYHDQPIVGTASWELLETHLVEDRPIYKQGAVTGRCEGRIVELREYSGGYREIDVDIHSGGGDSGGPYFVESDNGLLVAAIHKGVRTDTNVRRGIFVDSVCDSLGVDIY